MTNVSILIAVAAAVTLASLWRVLAIRNNAVAARAEPVPVPGERIDIELGELAREALGSDNDSVAPLRVKVCPEQIRTLLEHLRALAQGTALRWLLRQDGAHAVLHLVDDDVRGERVQLTDFFDGRWPARGALRDRIALCQRIVRQHSGRIYAAPSPLGRLALTVRLPLLAPALCGALAGCGQCSDSALTADRASRVSVSTLAPIMVTRHTDCPMTAPTFEIPLRAVPVRAPSNVWAAAE